MMTEKSGAVAILNVAGDAVVEIRDLGPVPVPVKASMVRTFVETRPALAPGQVYTGFADEILTTKVKRVWSVGDAPVILPDTISDRQFFQALALEPFELITQEEALAAVKTGEIPAAMLAVLPQLPEGARFSAEMLLSGATSFNLSHPLVEAFAAAFAVTPSEIWEKASVL